MTSGKPGGIDIVGSFMRVAKSAHADVVAIDSLVAYQERMGVAVSLALQPTLQEVAQ